MNLDFTLTKYNQLLQAFRECGYFFLTFERYCVEKAELSDLRFVILRHDVDLKADHSLATAKANWEEIKKTVPEEERANHPCRYALCELENIHEEGIVFEPIHRILFSEGRACGAMMAEETLSILKDQNQDACIAPQGTKAGEHQYAIPVLYGGEEKVLLIDHPSSGIEVGALQNALDLLIQQKGYRIDYIHGEEALRNLAAKDGNAGFLLPPMDKHRLFPAVAADGALPRKTFSMGEAVEKRYYIEARSLV